MNAETLFASALANILLVVVVGAIFGPGAAMFVMWAEVAGFRITIHMEGEL